MRIAQSRNNTLRLVEGDIAQSLRFDRIAVHRDLVSIFSLIAKRDNLAVHHNTTLADKLLSPATRTIPATSKDLLNTFHTERAE